VITVDVEGGTMFTGCYKRKEKYEKQKKAVGSALDKGQMDLRDVVQNFQK